MDILKNYYDFANAVAAALNAGGVRPVTDGNATACAVMVVVFPASPETGNPVGGSMNYEDGKWVPSIQLDEARKV